LEVCYTLTVTISGCLTVKRLEAELRKREEKPSGTPLPELSGWVREQLKDLAGLLKSDPAKVKSDVRRLNSQLTFQPTEAEPRAHYVVNGQCALSALVFFYLRSRRPAAVWTHLVPGGSASPHMCCGVRSPRSMRVRASSIAAP
jgi:hypothetical protein